MSGVLTRPAHAPSLLSGGSTREKSPQLLEAVRLGDLPTAQALLSRRADPDSRDGHGLGALHIACAHSQPALLSLLLEAGADIEMPSENRFRVRAIHAAAATARSAEGVQCINKLLLAGANPTATRADGRMPSQIAPTGSRVRRTLHMAESGWKSREGERVTRAALVHSVASGRTMRVAELLDCRTHPDSVDEHGTPALHAACARGDSASWLVQALIKAGASVNKPARDRFGSRPLHCAAQAASERCVTLLLAAHADPMRRDRAQRLAMELCSNGSSAAGGGGGGGGDPQGTLALLTKATQQQRSKAGRLGATKGLSRAEAPPCLSVGVHIKGPVTEVRLTNEGEIGGGRGGDAAEEEVGTTALGTSGRGGGGVGASNNGVMLHVQLAGIGIYLVDGEP